jgi:hypothetical protein
MLNFDVEREKQIVEAINKDYEDYQQKSIAMLKKEWGDKYQEHVEKGKMVLNRFADDDIKKMIETTRFGDNPQVIRLLANIAEKLSEDVLVDPKQRQGDDKEMERTAGGTPQLDFKDMPEGQRA